MIYISDIISIALKAGNAIMEIYNSDNFEVEIKSDNSPLTRADKVSHEIIKNSLSMLHPSIPVLSEEGKGILYEARKNWEKYWLVDPLDGTKEFIKKNDEFTVNIALIENNHPVLGVIYAPAYNNNLSDYSKHGSSDESINFPGTIYFAQKGLGTFKMIENDNPVRIEMNNSELSNKVIAVKSRSHSSDEEDKVLKNLNVTDYISVGSSLKFCMIAEGKAQIYYRHGPTNEWDVGAGYAIAKYAGAKIEGLEFNKQNLLNGSFLLTKLNDSS